MDHPGNPWTIRKALRVFFAVASGVSSSRKGDLTFVKTTNHENEKDARREMIAIQSINPSGKSKRTYKTNQCIKQSKYKKQHMLGKSTDICGQSNVVGGEGGG